MMCISTDLFSDDYFRKYIGVLVSQRIRTGSETDPERPKSANLKAVL